MRERAPHLTFSRRTAIAGLGLAPLVGVAAQDAPGAQRLVNLNTASLGPTLPRAFDATLQAWQQLETDPVKMGYGRNDPTTIASQADAVRGKAAALIGCSADEILLTHGTTDGMNIVAQSIGLAAGDHVLTTDQEHHGGSMCWSWHQRHRGVIIDLIEIALDNGDPADIVARFAKAIGPKTRVISVSHVISTTGFIMPIAEISALARSRDVMLIVDGAQAAGNIAVDVKALGCHAYATSGHKWLMGPKGTGILYISSEAGQPITPIQWQDGFRYSAESAGVGPFPLVIGFGAAIDACLDRGMVATATHNLALRNTAHTMLSGMRDLTVVGPPPGALASAIVAVRLPVAVDGMAIRLAMLDRHGIIVKMTEKRWLNGIRLSPHIFNSAAEVERAVRALADEVALALA